MRARATALVTIAWLVAGIDARASEEAVTYSLGWTRMPGAETCVAAGALARAVEARLGHPAWAPASAAKVSIEGYVEKRSDGVGWRAHVELTDERGTQLGQRDVTSQEVDCAALEQPLTLVLALIIDPRLLLDPDPTIVPPISLPVQSRAEPGRDVSPIGGPTERPAPRAQETPAAIPGRGEIHAGVAVAAGLLPGVAAGITLNEALPLGSWSAELGGTLFLPREIAAESGRGATFSLLALAARACPLELRDTKSLLRACGGAAGGVIVAQGFGFDQPDRAQRPAFFALASVEGAVRVAGPVWAGVRLEGLVPLVREEFTYRSRTGGDSELFQMSVVAGTAGVSLGLHF